MKHEEQMFVPIDEKLFVPTDKKISEMMTVSLDPDIAVLEKEDFVQLQGQVLLQGKYKKVADNHISEVIAEDKPYIKDIQELHYDEVIFAHPFPVEITIAAYRIENITDITVKVAHFDYEIIEPEKMHVKARLEIAGLQPVPTKAESNEVEEAVAQIEEKAESVEKAEEVVQEEEKLVDLSTAETEEVVDAVSTPKAREEEASKLENEIEEDVIEAQVTESEETEEADSEVSETQAVHIGHTTDEDASEHTLFLRQLFADEEGENERVTLYITQSQDTIETVATRYEISTYQLMKDNDLTEDILEEGQILKIR